MGIDRVKVIQDNRIAGTIPKPDEPPRAYFRGVLESGKHRVGDPMASLRSSDFKLEWRMSKCGWIQELVMIADPMLGPGDLADIRGFEPA